MNLSFFEKWIWNNIQTIELKLRYMSKNTELSLSFDVSIFQDIQARDWIPVSRMRDELSSNWATTAVLHIVKGDQPERSSGRDCITEVPCYNKRRTIKKSLPAQRLRVLSIGLNFAVLHCQLWLIHKREIFSNGRWLIHL